MRSRCLPRRILQASATAAILLAWIGNTSSFSLPSASLLLPPQAATSPMPGTRWGYTGDVCWTKRMVKTPFLCTSGDSEKGQELSNDFKGAINRGLDRVRNPCVGKFQAATQRDEKSNIVVAKLHKVVGDVSVFMQEFVTIAFPAFIQFIAEPLASLVGKTKHSPKRIRLNGAPNPLCTDMLEMRQYQTRCVFLSAFCADSRYPRLTPFADTIYIGKLGAAALGGVGVAISAQYSVSKLYNE
jgi:hypothetical protein